MIDLPSSAPRLRSNFWVLIALLLLIAPLGLAWPQEPTLPKSHPDDDYTISVNVDVVVLHATAQDKKGALVSGLGKDDFQIYEDGALQAIKYFSHEDMPVTVGLVVDNSGSMRSKRADVIAAEISADKLLNLRVFFPKLKQTREYGLRMQADGSIRAFYNRDQKGNYSIRNGLFSANGRPTPPNYKCRSGTQVGIPVGEGRNAGLSAEG